MVQLAEATRTDLREGMTLSLFCTVAHEEQKKQPFVEQQRVAELLPVFVSCVADVFLVWFVSLNNYVK